MSERTLIVETITPEGFAPFGDVIAAGVADGESMNEARFDRYRDLATIDAGPDGRTALSIIRSREATPLPYRFDLLERHPLGSQAFIPLAPTIFVVVVAPAGDVVDVAKLRAFVTEGPQGVNYRRGVWHMPLIAFERGQEFLIVDRAAGAGNYEEYRLGEPVTLTRRGDDDG